MRRSRNVGAALVGLLVVAAITVAAGSGRKPAMGGAADVSVRQISANEVKDILHRFPEIVPVWVTAHPNDTSHLKLQFPLKEVTSTYLERALPGVRFYQGLNFRQPPGPYMMAIAGGKGYGMPNGFNRLLVDNGLKVTDENVIELAEAFVVVALGEWGLSYPQIDFLEAKKSKLKPDVWTIDAAVLKVRVGEHTEEWHFNVLRNQFVAAGSKNEEGSRRDYRPVIIDSLPGRGQLAPTPDMVIDTTKGKAYAENEVIPPSDTLSHYYVIADSNNIVTNNKVFFSLSGFPSCSTNVWLQVIDSVRNNTIWRFKNVTIDSTGSGSDTWMPPVSSTGICYATAGYVSGEIPGTQ